MNLRIILLTSVWIILGTLLFLKRYFYESGSICSWLAVATITWPSLTIFAKNKPWHLIGWFHTFLIPLFLAAHIIGCKLAFWTYESTYLIMIPSTIPLIGNIPLFEFAFYSVFTVAVLGLYSFTEDLFKNSFTRNILMVRAVLVIIWIITLACIIYKPNQYRTDFPVWFTIMFTSSIPFSLALMDVPPFARILPFVHKTCIKSSFIAVCMMLFPLMALWELASVKAGVWVYNRSMLLSSIAALDNAAIRLWPIDMLYGHANTVIIIFLATFYQSRNNAANT